MAEPYLDRNKLIQWLCAHQPVVKEPPRLVLDSDSDRVMASEYEVVLKIKSVAEKVQYLGLPIPLAVSELFPHDARHFTTVQLADLYDRNELDEEYMQRVEEQWNLLRWQLAWETDPPPSFNIGKVRERKDLGTLQCHLRVQGTLPRHLPGVGYTTNPYVSVTDGSFPLDAFLEEKALDEAWTHCWVLVRWREFL